MTGREEEYDYLFKGEIRETDTFFFLFFLKTDLSDWFNLRLEPIPNCSLYPIQAHSVVNRIMACASYVVHSILHGAAILNGRRKITS